MKLHKYSAEQLKIAVEISTSMRQVLQKLNVAAYGGNYDVLRKAIKYFNLNVSHFTGQAWNKGKKCPQLSGKNNPMYGKKNPAFSKILKDPKITKKRLMACIKKPNKLEIVSIELLNKNFPKEWKYVGDGSVIIGNKNPDFMNVNGKKLLIELWGDYWHNKEKVIHTKNIKNMSEDYFNEEKRKEIFRKYGFETLIIWENELKNCNQIVGKIKEFNKMEEINKK